MSGKHPAPALPGEQLAIAWQTASLLLDYPDESLLARLGMLRRLSETLAGTVGDPLRAWSPGACRRRSRNTSTPSTPGVVTTSS